MATVFIFVLVDILILTVYTAVDGALGGLAPIRVPHSEDPSDVVEVKCNIAGFVYYSYNIWSIVVSLSLCICVTTDYR